MKLVLPDLVSLCPIKWSVNPEYERARAESTAWVESFGALTGRAGAVFKSYNLELLSALVYPDAPYKELKACCDINNMVFIHDELSDHVGGEEARKLCDVFLDALGGKFTRGSVISDMAEDFRERFNADASPNCQKRFLASCADYLNAVSKEAVLREAGHILQIDSYIELRRENSGIRPFIDLIEYVHGIDLPDEVFENPVFMRLYWLGVDLVWLANDLYSFSAERAKGLEGNNFLSVVMRQKEMSIQEAADFTANEITLRFNQLLEGQAEMPSFGDGVDKGVQKYISSLAQWHIGNVIWSFETSRYFGAERDEVKKTLIVNVKDPGDNIDSEIYEKYSGSTLRTIP